MMFGTFKAKLERRAAAQAVARGGSQRGRLRRGRLEAAFTLVELMAVVAIVAILGAVALPALTRDDIDSRFKRAVRQFAQDLQRARYEALSNREHRSIDILGLHSYELQAVVPGVTPLSRALLASRQLEQRIELYAVTLEAAHPDNTTATIPSSPTGTPAEIQFTSTSEVWALIHSPGAAALTPDNATSLTVWMRALAADGTTPLHRARIVLYQATGYARIYGESFDASGTNVISRW